MAERIVRAEALVVFGSCGRRWSVSIHGQEEQDGVQLWFVIANSCMPYPFSVMSPSCQANNVSHHSQSIASAGVNPNGGRGKRIGH